MEWTFYVVVMLLVVLATIVLVQRYKAPSASFVVLTVVAISWATALSVVALVPIDVYTSLTTAMPPQALDVLWSISYWTTQFLTWLIIPVMQGFADAGEFTAAGRLRTSIRDNLRFWVAMGCLGAFGAVFLVVTGNFNLPDIKKTVIVLSNTYGLLVVLFLLGYGLVEIPRTVWRRSFPETRLKWHYYRLGKAAERLEQSAFDLQRCMQVVQATSAPMSRRDVLRPYMDVILRYVEQYSPLQPDAVDVDIESMSDSELDYGLDKHGLAQLQRRVMRTVHAYASARTEYSTYVRRAFELDALCRSRSSRDYTPPSNARSKWKQTRWRYRCLVRPWVMRLLALGLALSSAVVVWCEATIGLQRHPDVSPFSLALRNMQRGEFATQAMVGAPLCYMCIAAYYSLFKLGMFSFYHLVVKASSGSSLLLSGSLLCRFAAPLCFNFLHVIRMDAPKDGEPWQPTVFVKKMGGAMNDASPSFNAIVNRVFPITMVLYVLILVMELWDNALFRACARVGRMFAPEKEDLEHTERGKQLLRQEQDSLTRGNNIGDVLSLFAAALSSPGIGRHSRSASRTSLQMGSLTRTLAPPNGAPSPSVLPTAGGGGAGGGGAGQGHDRRLSAAGGVSAAFKLGGGGGVGNGGGVSEGPSASSSAAATPLAAAATGGGGLFGGWRRAFGGVGGGGGGGGGNGSTSSLTSLDTPGRGGVQGGGGVAGGGGSYSPIAAARALLGARNKYGLAGGASGAGMEGAPLMGGGGGGVGGGSGRSGGPGGLDAIFAHMDGPGRGGGGGGGTGRIDDEDDFL